MSNKLLSVLAVLTLATAARAEVQRTQYATENRFPKVNQLETGGIFAYSESEDNGLAGDIETTSLVPYARYGLLNNLTASARLPFVSQDADVGDSDFGIGSLELGLQLRAFEDVVGYPFVIPHVEVQVDTADDDLKSSAGETFTTIGLSVGTVVEDTVTFVLDGRYKLYQDQDNAIEGALAVLWTLSDKFSWIGEVRVRDSDDVEGTPVDVLGGFSYQWTRQLASSFHVGGGSSDSEDDVVAAAKVAYTW